MELFIWTYALRHAYHICNGLTDKEDGTSHVEHFAISPISPKLRENLAFVLLVYALQNHLQAGVRISKWNLISSMRLYLVPLPRHVRSVSLILNMETSIILLQFRVQYDDFFEPV